MPAELPALIQRDSYRAMDAKARRAAIESEKARAFNEAGRPWRDAQFGLMYVDGRTVLRAEYGAALNVYHRLASKRTGIKINDLFD